MNESGTLTLIRGNIVRHFSGFLVIAIWAYRPSCNYIEGDHILDLPMNEGAPKAYYSSPLRWRHPHDHEPITPDRQATILSNIAAALRVMEPPVRLVRSPEPDDGSIVRVLRHVWQGLRRPLAGGSSGERRTAALAPAHRADAAFREVRPGIVLHASGFMFVGLGRDVAHYVEGGHIIDVSTEPGDVWTFYLFPIKWRSPHDAEQIPPQRQKAIRANIEAAVRFMNTPAEFVYGQC